MGRSTELSELLLLLAQAAKGEGGMVLLEGEAGIGKTFLLEEALDRAETLGFRCFIGGAEELERHRPFGAISESLGIGRRGRSSSVAHPGEDERRARIAELLAGDAGAAGNALLPGAPEAEFRIVDGLVDFVENLCSGGPVVMALEDLQWSDPSTLLALNRLGREIPRLPAVLIATLRPLPRSADLQVLLEGLASRGAVQLTLGRLDEEAVATLVETLLEAKPGAGLLGQVARAGGNPFFATELVASLQREGAVTVVDNVAEVTEVVLPSSLSNAILQRLSFLSEEARETLQVASILGSSFSVANLAVAVGKHAPALTPILASAVRAGILGEDGRLLTFRHDLIRDVLYQSMPAAARDWLHLAAAHFLAEAGRPYEELAEHVVRGAAPGDVHAIEWLWTAARQAAPRSPAVAVELLERALELVPDSDPQRDAAQAELALCLLRSGYPAKAEQVCREVLGREHDRSLEGQLRQCLIEGAVGQGRIDEGLREVEEAIEAPSLSDFERARLWAWSSTCRAIIWDLQGAVEMANRALEAAERLGDDVGAGVALGNLAVVLHLRGEFPEALNLAHQALRRIALGASAPTQTFQPVLNLAASLMDLDCLEVAQATLLHWRQFRRQRGAAWNHPTDQFVSAIGYFWSGEWNLAITALQMGVDLADTTGIRRGTLVGHSLRALIAVHQGDLGIAERELTAAEADAKSTGPQWRPDWMMWARALLLEADGRIGEALRTLTRAWELCREAGVVAEYPVIGPDLVRLALAARKRDLAVEVTAAVEKLAGNAGVSSVSGAALRCRGFVESHPDILLEAVVTYRRSPRRHELALACEDAAVALGAAARATEARWLAEEALEIYGVLEARSDASRALSRFRAAGLRSRPLIQMADQRTRARFGWESLTEAEKRVASLVAEGLSNRDVARRLGISYRTVASHMTHIFDKMGVSSRVELAVEVAAAQQFRTPGTAADLRSSGPFTSFQLCIDPPEGENGRQR